MLAPNVVCTYMYIDTRMVANLNSTGTLCRLSVLSQGTCGYMLHLCVDFGLTWYCVLYH